MIASLCDSSAILHVIYYVKIALDVIGICAPILLILSLSLELLSAVKSQVNDALANVKKKCVPMFVSAIVIFLIPGLVRIVVRVSSDDFEFVACINKANKETISQLKAEEDAEKKLQEEEKRKKWEEKLQEQKELEEASKDDISSNTGSDSSNYVNGGNVTSANITAIDVTDLGCPLYYSDHVILFKQISVNDQVADQMHSILTNVCTYTNRTPWMKNLETAGAYVNKPGYHGRGLAIDLNNAWEYHANGKTYMPYALYGGTNKSAWPKYQQFICEVCNGKEDCKYNINYQIYERYFKNNGWCWGGNWNPDYFDPMHFELSDSGCAPTNNSRINCG